MDGSLEVVEITQKTDIPWCSIFNKYDYFALHNTGASHYYILRNKTNNETEALCHFTETEPGVFLSPGRGTYAGVEMRKNSLPEISLFIAELEGCLKQKGANKIILSTAPFDHAPAFSACQFNALTNLAYQINNHELNYAIAVNEVPLIEKMNYNNVKRLKKCQREGFGFEQVHTAEGFKEVYDIIAVNRAGKGYNVSMTFEQVMQMHALFADSLFFFKATTGSTSIAGSICIKLSANTLYVFYWGDLPGYEQYSPISLIADGIYTFARQNNFKLLDAGTSTLKGVPNQGLIRFKENLGFNASLKLTYSKTL